MAATLMKTAVLMVIAWTLSQDITATAQRDMQEYHALVRKDKKSFSVVMVILNQNITKQLELFSNGFNYK